MKNKIGQIDNLAKIILWAIFFAIALVSVYLLIRRLTE
jgi:hypothetical protein